MPIRQQIEQDGFALTPAVYTGEELASLIAALTSGLRQAGDLAVSRRRGVAYGARNVLDWFPAAHHLWRRAPLVDLIQQVLGPDAGLVRGLYFDKPPGQRWSLPWHRDRTIAVATNARPPAGFSKPTRKAGVDHLEAPVGLLEQMLTLRIHFDDANQTNGALQVLRGSHRIQSRSVSGDSGNSGVSDSGVSVNPADMRLVEATAGDVLAMRPLIAHSSGTGHSDTTAHRRILHLEFAATAELPGPLRWRWFVGS